jgi:adenylate cyclase
LPTAAIDAKRLAPQQVAAKLGVRYLLGGSIQRDYKRVRTTVTLMDVADESELWSDHFDRPLDDIFQVQDDITNAVIAAIEPAIERAEMARALLKPPDSLTAWEQFHRGLWQLLQVHGEGQRDRTRAFHQGRDPRPSLFPGLRRAVVHALLARVS